MSGMDGNMKLATVTTLDEPIMTTIMRDLNQVQDKLKVVLLPLGKDAQENVLEKLRDCKFDSPSFSSPHFLLFYYWDGVQIWVF